MKLRDLFLETPVLNPKTSDDIKRAIDNIKKEFSRKFAVQKFEKGARGEITISQKTATFEKRVKFPPSGQKGSPFSAAKMLNNKAHDAMDDIISKEFRKVKIDAKSLGEVNRGARSGEVVFSIDELGKGWVEIDFQYRIPDKD